MEGVGLSGVENGLLTRRLLVEGWHKRNCASFCISRTNKEKSMLQCIVEGVCVGFGHGGMEGGNERCPSDGAIVGRHKPIKVHGACFEYITKYHNGLLSMLLKLA